MGGSLPGGFFLIDGHTLPEDPDNFDSYVRLAGSCRTYDTDRQDGYECNSGDVLREWCFDQVRFWRWRRGVVVVWEGVVYLTTTPPPP